MDFNSTFMENNSGNNGNWSPFLYVIAASCQLILSLDINYIYNWSFKLLSLLSVLLIVIINIPKAKRALKSLREKSK